MYSHLNPAGPGRLGREKGPRRDGRGFHLTPAPESYISQVVQALKEIDPDYLVPMHYSGAGFARAVQNEMSDKLIVPYTGTRFIFGA